MAADDSFPDNTPSHETAQVGQGRVIAANQMEEIREGDHVTFPISSAIEATVAGEKILLVPTSDILEVRRNQ